MHRMWSGNCADCRPDPFRLQSTTYSDTLKEAKAIQYYLTLKRLLAHLDIDITKLPLFFNFVPREEFLRLGPESDILHVLLGLHEPASIKLYAKIIKRAQPWIFTFACPCGLT